MIVRTQAIVLHALSYGETSQIVSVLTRKHGRMGMMARGSRRPKSRFGSALQPMSYVEVVYYYKPGRELQTLKEASHVRLLRFIPDDVLKISVGFRMVELLRALTEPGDAQPAIFNRTLHSLLYLDAATTRPENVLPHFELGLAAALGFAPAIDKEAVADVPAGGGALDLSTGGIIARGGGSEGAHASREALRAFAIFARVDLETALRLRLSDAVFEETLALIDTYLRHHVHGHYPDRAGAVGRQLRRLSRVA